VCEECYAEAMALIEAEGEVERKPAAAASAEPRNALTAWCPSSACSAFQIPANLVRGLPPGRLRFSLCPVTHLTCALGP